MRKKSGRSTDNAKDSRIFKVEKKRMVKYLKGDIMNTFFLLNGEKYIRVIVYW